MDHVTAILVGTGAPPEAVALFRSEPLLPVPVAEPVDASQGAPDLLRQWQAPPPLTGTDAQGNEEPIRLTVSRPLIGVTAPLPVTLATVLSARVPLIRHIPGPL